MITGLDHVQLACPAGSEDALRAFYGGVLGMEELPKPAVLAERGGCWFRAGAVVLHLGVEAAPAGGGPCHFRAARKAHPGLRVADIDAYAARLEAGGARVVWDDALPGHRRFYSEDPVGNRLEFLEPVAPAGFAAVPTTVLADLVGADRVMDLGIRPLWPSMPRLAGPAYTVRCPRGDNLMLHAAVHRAPPGSVIVVESGDTTYALAGGNVCAVAQRRGVAGFVLDGVLRDVAEPRAAGFPVFARGVVPVPGTKKAVTPLDEPVRCGGVLVHAGDIVVADEDGVVAVPHAHAPETLPAAQATLAAQEPLATWEATHRARIDALLNELA